MEQSGNSMVTDRFVETLQAYLGYFVSRVEEKEREADQEEALKSLTKKILTEEEVDLLLVQKDVPAILAGLRARVQAQAQAMDETALESLVLKGRMIKVGEFVKVLRELHVEKVRILDLCLSADEMDAIIAALSKCRHVEISRCGLKIRWDSLLHLLKTDIVESLIIKGSKCTIVGNPSEDFLKALRDNNSLQELNLERVKFDETSTAEMIARNSVGVKVVKLRGVEDVASMLREEKEKADFEQDVAPEPRETTTNDEETADMLNFTEEDEESEQNSVGDEQDSLSDVNTSDDGLGLLDEPYVSEASSVTTLSKAERLAEVAELEDNEFRRFEIFIAHAARDAREEIVMPLKEALARVAPHIEVFEEERSTWHVDEMSSSKLIMFMIDSDFFGTKNAVEKLEKALQLKKEVGSIVLPVSRSNQEDINEAIQKIKTPEGWSLSRLQALLDEFAGLVDYPVFGNHYFRLEHLAELATLMVRDRCSIGRQEEMRKEVQEIENRYKQSQHPLMKRPTDIKKFRSVFAVPRLAWSTPALDQIHHEQRVEFLVNFLEASHNSTRIIGVIFGPGGYAKAASAKWIATHPQVLDHFRGGIYWKEMGERTDIKQLFEDLWNALCYDQDAPADEDALHFSLVDILKRTPCLLVFDNVRSTKVAQRLLSIVPPGSKSSLIFTGQQGKVFKQAVDCPATMIVCELGPLGTGESMRLIKRRLRGSPLLKETTDRVEALYKLSTRLNGYPLLLDLVARFIKFKNCQTWSEVRSLFERIVGKVHPDEEPSKAAVNFILDEMDLGTKENFNLVAVFDLNEPLSSKDLYWILQTNDDCTAEKFRNVLVDAGFLLPSDSGDTFKVRHVLKDLVFEGENAEEIVDRAHKAYVEGVLNAKVSEWTTFACNHIAVLLNNDPCYRERMVKKCVKVISRPGRRQSGAEGRAERRNALDMLLSIANESTKPEETPIEPFLDELFHPNCPRRREVLRLITRILLKTSSGVSEKVYDTLVRAVTRFPWLFPYLPEEMRENSEVVELVLSRCGSMLRFASERFKRDKHMVTEAVKSDPRAIRYSMLEDDATEIDLYFHHVAPTGRWQELEYMRDATRKNEPLVLKLLEYSHESLKFAHDDLREDKGFLFRAIEVHGLALKHAKPDESFRRKLEEAAVVKNGIALKFCDDKSRADKDLVFGAFMNNAKALQFAKKDLLGEKEFVLKLVDKKGKAIAYVSEALKNDPEVVCVAVEQDPDCCVHLTEEMRGNPEVAPLLLKDLDHKPGTVGFDEAVRRFVQADGMRLRFLPDVIRDKEKVVKVAVQSKGLALQFASPRLKRNKIIVRLAIIQTWEALEFAHPELRGDKEIALTAIGDGSSGDGLALAYVSGDLQKDVVVVKAAVRANWRSLFYSDESLRGDLEIARLAVSKSWEALQDLDLVRLQKCADDLVKLAIESSKKKSTDGGIVDSSKRIGPKNINSAWRALDFASLTLKDDKEYIMSVLQKFAQDAGSWEALFFASTRLRDDPDVVRAALEQKCGGWNALLFAGQNIIKDEGIVKFAVEKNWRALQFASLSLRHNKSVILHAIRSKTFLSRKAFIFADESLRNDPDFVLECLKQPVKRSHEILTLVDHSLLQDQDFAQAVRNLGPEFSQKLDLLIKNVV